MKKIVTSSLPDLTEIIERLEALFSIAHSPEWLMAAFAREAKRLGVTSAQLWHLWFTYCTWG